MARLLPTAVTDTRCFAKHNAGGIREDVGAFFQFWSSAVGRRHFLNLHAEYVMSPANHAPTRMPFFFERLSFCVNDSETDRSMEGASLEPPAAPPPSSTAF